MDFTIGVDIGGSAIKFAVVDREGSIVWPPGRPELGSAAERVAYNVPTPGVARLTWQATGEVEELAYEAEAGSTYSEASAEGLPENKWTVPAVVAKTALKKVLERIAASFSGSIAAVGIGATGLIGHDGIVREGYAFTGYHGTDWTAVAKEAGFRGRVLVLNDARAAAWAEYMRVGSGSAFLHVTVGTRVGCAIVQDGHLLEGADSCAGEFSYQQFIGPDTIRYRAGARLMDCSPNDPTAFGAALTGVVHIINPERIVLRGFAPGFVTAVQAHVDRYVFKTHWRKLAEEEQEGSGSTLCVTRRGNELVSTIMREERAHTKGVAPDFLNRIIVGAPMSLGPPGSVFFGEIGGSFGIEADYCARTARRVPFDEIAAAGANGDTKAAVCLEQAAMITGAGIVNVCRMTGAKLVTVGGAVPLLYGPYMQILSGYVTMQFSVGGLAPTIQPSAGGNDAGVIGAALYARRVATSAGP